MKSMNLKWLTLVMAILVSISMVSCSKSDSSSPSGSAAPSSGSASSSVSEATNAWDKVLDDYEKLVDEYVVVMKKSQEDGDLDGMLKAVSIMEDVSAMSLQIANGATELSLSQATRFSRISNKLMLD